MDKKSTVVRNIVILFIAIVWFVPLIFMFEKSFEGGIVENYAAVFERNDILRNALNSVVITGGTIAVVLIITALAGFAFSKLTFKGKNILYLLILAGLMIPAPTLIVPLAQLVKNMGLINNPISLIGIYSALNAPFCLMLMKNYFDELPTELVESGIVDGCTVFGAFRKILLPLCGPIIVAVTIFTFVAAWNEFLMAFMFLKKTAYQTLTVIPHSFSNMYMNDLPKVFASLVVIASPVIVTYICLQKHFERGLTAGAVKG